MIWIEIISDMFFAGIAGVGFGVISDPPLKAIPYIALLSAIGHGCRFCLMRLLGAEIALGSFIGALLIGFGSLLLGKNVRVPMTVLYIPALLPMIPGKFAYNMVFSQIMFLQSLNTETRSTYMEMFFSNAMITSTVVFALAVGATIPMFLFPNRAFSLTRSKNKH